MKRLLAWAKRWASTTRLASTHDGGAFDGSVSLDVPVQRIRGKLVLVIPLEAGGQAFVSVTRDIARVVGPNLEVTIPDLLAENVGIAEGAIVNVHNRDGLFNIAYDEVSDDG